MIAVVADVAEVSQFTTLGRKEHRTGTPCGFTTLHLSEQRRKCQLAIEATFINSSQMFYLIKMVT